MSRVLRHQVSLVLNVVLLVTVIVLLLGKSDRAPGPSVPEANLGNEMSPRKMTDETLAFSKEPTSPKSPQYPDTASVSEQRRWIIDQLRAAGVPSKVLARIALADIEAHWEARFWEETRRGADNDKMSAMQLEFDMSKDAEMRAALGEEDFKLWDQENMLREANIGGIPLTVSEAEAIYDLKKKLQQRQWELELARLKKEMDEAEIDDAYAKAYSEFNQQMKALLGEQRYAKSQGIDHETAAAHFRQQLAKVNPTDSQFQELLEVHRQFNERLSELEKQFQNDPSSAVYAAQLKALNEARDREFQRVLGADAFDTLQKEQDASYLKMKKYAHTWGLDDNKIDYVFRTMKYYEKSVEDYIAQARVLEAQGQSVDWDAVNKNLQQFTEQIQQSLQNFLGQDRFDRMQRNYVFRFNQITSRGLFR